MKISCSNRVVDVANIFPKSCIVFGYIVATALPWRRMSFLTDGTLRKTTHTPNIKMKLSCRNRVIDDANLFFAFVHIFWLYTSH